MVSCFNDKIIAREKRKNYLGLKSILRKGAAVTITEERSMQRGASLICNIAQSSPWVRATSWWHDAAVA